jgi:diguanylate cyclase (GGDEF)-like protein/PAS domain S-box-containing protein
MMSWPRSQGSDGVRAGGGEQHSCSIAAAVDFIMQMTVPAVLCPRDAGILISNGALNALTGGASDEPCVLGVFDCWACTAEVYEALQQTIRDDSGATFADQQFDVPQAGVFEKKWFTLNLFPLHDASGAVAGAAVLFIDTTSRVLLERSLRDSERLLSAIFAQARVGMSLISIEGHFLRVNDELCRMLDRSREEMLQSGITDVTHPDDLDKTLKVVENLLSTGQASSIDKRYVRPDGSVVFANSIVNRLEGGSDADYLILAVTVDLTDRKRAQDAVTESEAKFRALAEASSALIWQLNPEGSVIYINPRHEVLLGIPPEQLLGYGWMYIVHEDDREDALSKVQVAIRTKQPTQRRVRIRFVDGQWHWMEAHLAPWFSAQGDYAGHVGIALDIDDAVRAQDELVVSNERLKLAIEGSGDGIWDWDLVRNSIDYSPRAREILCLGEGDNIPVADLVDDHIHPDDQVPLKAELAACLEGTRQAFQMEYRVHCPGDGWRWVLSRATVVAGHESNGHPHRMTGTVTDIEEKRRSEEIVWEHANFDLLTGLPNRRLFRDRLDHEIRKSQRTGLPLALLFIDLDRFKEANDLLGHTIGDQVLVEAAQRICGCVRSSDTVARLGGDEFTAILTELDESTHVESVAQKINDTLSRPFFLGNEVVYLSGSIGITLYPADAADAENLIRNADQAMYVVKNAGRNHFSYFTPSMQRQANERLRLISDLRAALGGNQLQVHYQPIIDLRSGSIVKAEALLRWLHPHMGMIEPAYFIGFAEEAGLISEIGDWVFREAARCSRRWGERLGKPFTVSVNKSPVQFVSRLNEVDWPAHLRDQGMSGSSVSVEITEGLLLDASPIVTDKLLRYHDAGIKVAIDDFGTGHSSIAYLKKFEVDYLKIDQSFVRDIGSCGGDRAIVKSIIAMAHELGLEVIAEGIETVEQRDFLAAGQCDFGQGFLFSKAVPADQFEHMLCRA